MEIKRVLEELNAYYLTTRQAGHTTLMKRGISNYERKKLVMVHNMSYGRDLRIPKNEIVTLNSLDRLRGNDLPLVIDNSTLTTIFRESLSEYTRLEKERNVYRDANHLLQDDIRKMRANPFKTLFKTLWRRW